MKFAAARLTTAVGLMAFAGGLGPSVQTTLGQCEGPVEVSQLVPAGAGAGALAGSSSALAGDWAFVGAPSHQAGQGAVYVFRRANGSWQEFQKLSPTTMSGPPAFGSTIAADGDRLAVGARLESTGGHVYVYRYDGASWVLEQRISNPNPTIQDEFGVGVSLDGDRLAIGAWFEDFGASGAGSAYVYSWNGSAWVLEQRIDNPTPAADDRFGAPVRLSGDRLAVVADHDGAQGSLTGTVHVYKRTLGVWTLEQSLTRSSVDSEGITLSGLAFDGGRLILGARNSDAVGTDAGSVFVFGFDGANWVETQRLNAAAPMPGDRFGVRVALAGLVLVIGAQAGDGAAPDTGTVHVFRDMAGVWVEQDRIQASDGATGDGFFVVGLNATGDEVIVGANGNDIGMTTDAGSAYIFDLDPVGLTITDQPDGVATGPGQTVMFTAAVTGTAPITYQWRRNGVPLTDTYPFAGADTATLTISPTFINFGGTFDCVISNVCGSMVTTDPATLSVPECPGDADGSRTVTFQDVTAVLANFNAVCP